MSRLVADPSHRRDDACRRCTVGSCRSGAAIPISLHPSARMMPRGLHSGCGSLLGRGRGKSLKKLQFESLLADQAARARRCGASRSRAIGGATSSSERAGLILVDPIRSGYADMCRFEARAASRRSDTPGNLPLNATLWVRLPWAFIL